MQQRKCLYQILYNTGADDIPDEIEAYFGMFLFFLFFIALISLVFGILFYTSYYQHLQYYGYVVLCKILISIGVVCTIFFIIIQIEIVYFEKKVRNYWQNYGNQGCFFPALPFGIKMMYAGDKLIRSVHNLLSK